MDTDAAVLGACPEHMVMEEISAAKGEQARPQSDPIGHVEQPTVSAERFK